MTFATEKELFQKYSRVFISGEFGKKSHSFYQARRQKLLSALDAPAVFSGIMNEPGTENVWWMNEKRLIQEPSVLYLTGVNQPGVRLLLNPNGSAVGTPTEILFIPQKNSSKEFWEGTSIGFAESEIQDLKILTGFDDIRLIDDFYPVLKSVIHEPILYAFFHEYGEQEKLVQIKGDSNWRFAEELKFFLFENSLDVQVKSIARLHFSKRRILDEWQYLDSMKAQKQTCTAFLSLLPKIPTLQKENRVAEELEYKLKYDNIWGLAFPTIVASGKNAGILHYVKNDEKMNDGELLLLDFGCRIGTQHADISRTVPINGEFNPLQALLYTIVLDTQKYHQSLVSPSKTFYELNQLTWIYLEQLLEDRFFSKGGKAKRFYSKNEEPSIPHGVSHLIGEQVHEGEEKRYYAHDLLEEGMLISSEPGLYGKFSIQLNQTQYEENLGIRIENDLLVTSSGCINLSEEIPVEIADLEHLMCAKS